MFCQTFLQTLGHHFESIYQSGYDIVSYINHSHKSKPSQKRVGVLCNHDSLSHLRKLESQDQLLDNPTQMLHGTNGIWTYSYWKVIPLLMVQKSQTTNLECKKYLPIMGQTTNLNWWSPEIWTIQPVCRFFLFQSHAAYGHGILLDWISDVCWIIHVSGWCEKHPHRLLRSELLQPCHVVRK